MGQICLTFEEASRIRWACQETVITINGDLDASMGINDLTARTAARKVLLQARELYLGMLGKLDDVLEQMRAENEEHGDDA